MKIRSILIIILVIALVVVYYLVVSGYLEQRNQQDVIEGQIAEAIAALALIPLPPADLQERLDTAQSELDDEKNIFSTDTNYTQIVNRILTIAQYNGVKAIPLTTQSWVSEEVLGQEYYVFRMDIAVTGTYPQFVNFLKQLETSNPDNLLIEYLTVEMESGVSLLDSTIRDTLSIDANIRIAVYASPPVTG